MRLGEQAGARADHAIKARPVTTLAGQILHIALGQRGCARGSQTWPAASGWECSPGRRASEGGQAEYRPRWLCRRRPGCSRGPRGRGVLHLGLRVRPWMKSLSPSIGEPVSSTTGFIPHRLKIASSTGFGVIMKMWLAGLSTWEPAAVQIFESLWKR